MSRFYVSISGWVLIIAGIVLMLTVGVNAYSLITLFVGFFLQLIYNSEGYKYFKYLHLGLLKRYGVSYFQEKAKTKCLVSFYLALIDFLAVIILPFFIIPELNLPWYFDSLIAIVYIVALKPIFSKIDEVDKEQINTLIEAYGQSLQEFSKIT